MDKNAATKILISAVDEKAGNKHKNYNNIHNNIIT